MFKVNCELPWLPVQRLHQTEPSPQLEWNSEMTRTLHINSHYGLYLPASPRPLRHTSLDQCWNNKANVCLIVSLFLRHHNQKLFIVWQVRFVKINHCCQMLKYLTDTFLPLTFTIVSGKAFFRNFSSIWLPFALTTRLIAFDAASMSRRARFTAFPMMPLPSNYW